MLRYTTDRARPGLVALYDIRPGNGAGQFLQPRSPHAANGSMKELNMFHNYETEKITRKASDTQNISSCLVLPPEIVVHDAFNVGLQDGYFFNHRLIAIKKLIMINLTFS